MTNPRGRNRVLQSPSVTPPALIPTIANYRGDDRELAAILSAIKQNLDVRNGVTGNPWERWLTERHLQELGLKGPQPVPTAPPDTLAVPVWTSQSKYALVTLLALAEALREHLPVGAGAAAEAVQDLRRRMDGLSAGISQSINEALSQLPAPVIPDVAGLIAQATEQLRAQVLAQQQAIARLQSTPATPARQFWQATAALVWTVDHNFGRIPHVVVFTDTGELIYPDITNPTVNQTVITHGRATAGSAMFQ